MLSLLLLLLLPLFCLASTAPPPQELSEQLSSSDPRTLRRAASERLVAGEYSSTAQLYAALISLEPSAFANYNLRYKLWRRAAQRLELGGGLDGDLRRLTAADLQRRMLADLDSLIGLAAYDEPASYTGDAKADKAGVAALASRAQLLAQQGNCSYAGRDYALLDSLPPQSTEKGRSEQVYVKSPTRRARQAQP